VTLDQPHDVQQAFFANEVPCSLIMTRFRRACVHIGAETHLQRSEVSSVRGAAALPWDGRFGRVRELRRCAVARCRGAFRSEWERWYPAGAAIPLIELADDATPKPKPPPRRRGPTQVGTTWSLSFRRDQEVVSRKLWSLWGRYAASSPSSRHHYTTSVPGVFAVGDVRYGSVKRVASAVGEGSIAIQMVHGHLGEI
jgi:hypothetical protein